MSHAFSYLQMQYLAVVFIVFVCVYSIALYCYNTKRKINPFGLIKNNTLNLFHKTSFLIYFVAFMLKIYKWLMSIVSITLIK